MFLIASYGGNYICGNICKIKWLWHPFFCYQHTAKKTKRYFCLNFICMGLCYLSSSNIYYLFSMNCPQFFEPLFADWLDTDTEQFCDFWGKWCLPWFFCFLHISWFISSSSLLLLGKQVHQLLHLHYMHLSKASYIAFSVYIWSVQAFPGKITLGNQCGSK